MIEELIDRYEDFGDAKIESILWDLRASAKTLEVTLYCMNRKNDYAYEKIVLSFLDVSSVRYVQNKNTDSSIVFHALILELEEEIAIDFYPDNVSNEWVMNELSDFLVRSKGIAFRVLP